MPSLRRTLTAALTLAAVALLPGSLAAQQHPMSDDGVSTFGEDFPHGVTFWTRREPDGCTICAPSIDFNAGILKMKSTPSDISDAFIRLHSQFGIGFRHISLAADVLWVPKVSHSTPTFSAVAQYEPISQVKRIYAAAGLGIVSNGSTSGTGFGPWAQGVVAYRSKIHDLTPFVQAGRILSGTGREWQFLLGVAHPVAPYKMHLP